MTSETKTTGGITFTKHTCIPSSECDKDGKTCNETGKACDNTLIVDGCKKDTPYLCNDSNVCVHQHACQSGADKCNKKCKSNGDLGCNHGTMQCVVTPQRLKNTCVSLD